MSDCCSKRQKEITPEGEIERCINPAASQFLQIVDQPACSGCPVKAACKGHSIPAKQGGCTSCGEKEPGDCPSCGGDKVDKNGVPLNWKKVRDLDPDEMDEDEWREVLEANGINPELYDSVEVLGVYKNTDINPDQPDPSESIEDPELKAEASKYPLCEFRRYGKEITCSVTGLPVTPEQCNRCNVETRERVASMGEKFVGYSSAIKRWVAAGQPTRTQEEIDYIYNQHCVKCQMFDKKKNACMNCGCAIKQTGNPLTNKLAMKTEKCPLGIWE